MSVSILSQLQMTAAALAAGFVLGLGLDILWFLHSGLKLPGKWFYDTLYLLAGALLLFTLFQLSGGSVRLDLLAFILAGALIHEKLLGRLVRRLLDYLAHFLGLPLEYAKKQLKKVLHFMKKILANAKNWYMIKREASCLRACPPEGGEEECELALNSGCSATAYYDTDRIRISYAVERQQILGRGRGASDAAAGTGRKAARRKHAASAENKRSGERRKMGAHRPAATGACEPGRNSDI